MPSIKIVALNTGEIMRVYKSEGEEALFAQLPPIANTQTPLTIDITENPVLAELADGNNWYRYQLNAGVLTRDGVTYPIHPNSEAESDRQALGGLFDNLVDVYLPLDPLDASTGDTIAKLRQRINQNMTAIKALTRIVRYVVKHLLKAI